MSCRQRKTPTRQPAANMSHPTKRPRKRATPPIPKTTQATRRITGLIPRSTRPIFRKNTMLGRSPESAQQHAEDATGGPSSYLGVGP